MSQVPAHSESDEFWFALDENPIPVTHYESQLLDHCLRAGLFVGPDNFVLSDVKAYKSHLHLQHELIVLSMTKAPRRHEQVSAQVHKLAVQRLMAGKEPQIALCSDLDDANIPPPSFLIKGKSRNLHQSSLSALAAPSNALSGNYPANDAFQLLPPSGLLAEYDLIASINLPQPRALPQPPADAGAAIRSIRRKERSAGESGAEYPKLPPPIPSTGISFLGAPCSTLDFPPHQDPQRCVSLIDFVILVRVFHDYKPNYQLFSGNCYWLSSIVMNTLRLYTKQSVVTADGSIISSDEDLKSPRALFSRLHRISSKGKMPGHFSSLGLELNVVGMPSNQDIMHDVIALWREELQKTMASEQEKRLRKLQFLNKAPADIEEESEFDLYDENNVGLMKQS